MNRLITTAALAAAAGAANAAPSFGPATNLTTAQRPAGVASADFNGDGIADLAVAADSIDRIDVFFGAGDGTFGPPSSIFTGGGTGPDALIASDVNGDGQPDLVAVLKNINTVRAYTNNAGAFTAAGSASTGARPVSIDAADLDNDGDTDFVTANRDGNSISVITNTAGAFSSASFAVGDEPRDAAPIDLDGDMLPEIAVSSSRDRTIYVLASGTFTTRQAINVGPVVRPEGLHAADVDGDGDTDLAVALSDDLASRAGVLFSNAGALGARVSAPTNGMNSSDITAADFDLDGDLDLAVTNADSAGLSVLENSGGAFAPGVATMTGLQPSHVLAADLDNNGSPDLAVTNRDSNTTSILLSQKGGDPEPTPCSPVDFAQPFGQLDIADVVEFLRQFGLGCP